ncbi:carbonic anhydrase [Cereibacter azotoformans]|uniref:Carbonic anhydrase n=1 Tax=Cereibacter sphaeroides (strain ATCC 17025 / ATH 2.4.3) TaxID=349102 RepID=A4WV05_CERS5|nr:carbonic anhydrase [Cereibacter azotoformans]ULB10433.1 carbonic anhydrase [Cereibacter azotoformans]
MCEGCSTKARDGAIARRQFMRLAAAGAGAGLLAGTPAAASGKARALMLSCMDYRLVDDFVRFMEDKGLHDAYDHVTLAGASLGAISDRFAAWRSTFWSHLDVAIQLHHIEEVIVLDHRDCGAYKLALGEEAVDTPEKETLVHTEMMRTFALAVKQRHPELAVRGWLMALDGTSEEVRLA